MEHWNTRNIKWAQDIVIRAQNIMHQAQNLKHYALSI
jgi:hypothetical protein